MYTMQAPLPRTLGELQDGRVHVILVLEHFSSVGTTTVTCTAVDTAGNEAVKSFTITVVYSIEADTTPPVFMQVSDVELNTTNPDGITYDYATPQVSDNIGVTVGPTCNPESGSTFPIGTTHVVCTASDAAGNSGNYYLFCYSGQPKCN